MNTTILGQKTPDSIAQTTAAPSAGSYDRAARTLKLISFREVCDCLSIKLSTGYDWRNPDSPRYKPDFPKPFYLSSRSVRFSHEAIVNWAFNQKVGGA